MMIRKRNAFTLVELLVAISIAGILIAFMLSAVSKVRTGGAMSRSIGNLRQISAGLNQFIGEHSGRFPESGVDVWVRGRRAMYWYNALNYYIEGNHDLDAARRQLERPAWQCCPGRPFPRFARYESSGVTVGYGWNHQFFGYDAREINIDRYGYGSVLAEVELPAQTIIVGTNQEKTAAGAVIGPDDLRNLFVYANRPSSARFYGGGLYLFVDGHVERLTPEEAARNNSYLFKKIKN